MLEITVAIVYNIIQICLLVCMRFHFNWVNSICMFQEIEINTNEIY